MKTTDNKNRRKADSYKAGILKQTGMATTGGGQAYMRPEYHDRISEIIALFGEDGMTVEDYLDNVLTEHFAQCQDAAVSPPDRETSHRKRNHDIRRMERPTADHPVKGYVLEITPADVEGLLSTFWRHRKSRPANVSILTVTRIGKSPILSNISATD